PGAGGPAVAPPGLVLGLVRPGRGIVGLLGLPGDRSVLHVDLPGAGAGAVVAVGGAHDLVMAPPLAVEGVAAAATHPVGLAIVLGDALGAAEHPARPDQGVITGESRPGTSPPSDVPLGAGADSGRSWIVIAAA